MINVIGLGYIGLPTALMFAAHGVEVIGSDFDSNLVATLNKGEVTFEEDGLEELFSKAVENGIRFSIDYQACDTYIISVPTPYDKHTKKIDPSYVVKAVESVLDVCLEGSTIVIESTISPGTIDRCIRPVIEGRGLNLGQNVHLAHAPERIIPGNMIHELEHNDRTIGADDLSIGERVRDLYKVFCQGEIAVTDVRTAEMTKVVENTFRDVNIAFANELAKICRFDNLDVREVIRIANMHPRVNILDPGPGVGGHCISVDPWFLVGDYPELTYLVRQARAINDSMPAFVLERAYEIAQKFGIQDPEKIGIYGLTYKKNVDDVRESPTLQMLENMDRHLAGNACKVYDPWVKEDIVPNQVHSMKEFLEDLEMVIVMVDHDEIRDSVHKFSDLVVLDTRDACGSGANIFKL